MDGLLKILTRGKGPSGFKIQEGSVGCCSIWEQITCFEDGRKKTEEIKRAVTFIEAKPEQKQPLRLVCCSGGGCAVLNRGLEE